MSKRINKQSIRIRTVKKLLIDAHEVIKSADGSKPQLSRQYLQAVAHMRVGITIVADMLYKHAKNEDSIDDDLLSTANMVCTDGDINQHKTGPGIFLLKQIIRQHGTDCLHRLAYEAPTRWVLPTHLHLFDEVGSTDRSLKIVTSHCAEVWGDSRDDYSIALHHLLYM